MSGAAARGDILFLAHRIPYPPDRGDKIRSFHLLRLLSGMARVHLAAFVDDPADFAHADALRHWVGGRLHLEPRRRSKAAAAVLALAGGRPVSLAAFASGAMRRAVRGMLAAEPIDTLFAFSGQMAQFVPSGLEGRRFVMDFVDMDSAKFAAYAAGARGPMRWMQAREARMLQDYEAAVAARADASLFVSAAEAALFRAATAAPRVAALENGIDLDHYAPRPHVPEASPLIVFTGQMDYPPNVAAAARFAAETLPLIRRARGDARFAIVGRAPVPELAALDGRCGVIVTGAVPDTRDWIARADVVVAPLALARGVQNKLLEAMAMGRPVVASPAAHEGIDAAPGRDLLVAAGAAEEAEAVLGLLADRARADRLGRAARARMAARYGWEARRAPLARLVARA